MDKLFIHLTGEERIQCLQVDEQGSAAGQPVSAPLQEMAGLAQGKQVVVLVPAERLVLTRVAVPTSSRQRQLQAVPYLLEDLLAEDVEQLHFALGSYRKGEVAVAVSAHEQMRRWLQRLAEAGIRAKSMLPDVLALPLEEGTWSVALADERALVRTGRETGFCCDTGNLSLLLGHALQQAGEAGPASLRLFDCREHPGEAVERLLPEGVEYRSEACERGILPLLAEGVHKGGSGPLNLLQGSYSQRERLSKLWRPWRPVAALGLLLVVVQMAKAGVEYQRLKDEKELLARQVEQTFRQGFPDIKRIVNPKLQAERRLESMRGAGGGAGFLTLLAEAGPVLKQVSGIQLRGLDYKGGKLVVGMQLKNLQQLDELEKKLKEKPELSVEVLSASSRDKHVEARIRIGAAA